MAGRDILSPDFAPVVQPPTKPGPRDILDPNFTPTEPPGLIEDVLRSAKTGIRSGLEASFGFAGDVQKYSGMGGAWLARRLGASEDTAKTIEEGTRGPQIPEAFDPPDTTKVRRAVRPMVGDPYEPQTPAGRYTKAGTEGATTALTTPGGSNSALRNIAMGFMSGMGSEGGGDIAKTVAPGSQTAETVGRLIGGVGGGYPLAGKSGAQRTIEREAERAGQRGFTGQQLRDEANPLFDQLDRAGVTYDSDQWNMMMRAAQDSRGMAGFHPTQHPGTAAALQDMERAGRGVFDRSAPPELTLRRLQSTRTLLTDVVRDGTAGDAQKASSLLDYLDNFVDTVTPTRGNLGTPEIADTYARARDLWRRGAKTSEAEGAVDIGELNASTANSGGNAENAVRQQVKGLVRRDIKNDGTSRFNPAETANMRAVTDGTDLQNRLRGFGNAYGGSGMLRAGQSAFSGSLGGASAIAAATGNPMTAAGLAAGAGLSHLGRKAGEGARAMSTRMGENQVDEWLRGVSTGNARPPITQTQQMMDILNGPPTRDKLAMLQQLGIVGSEGAR
ncbi:MAG TPA: hypothetical protein VK597_12465 [Inquilinus sp.]|nr:hypothetical protein [Inquilinus sp.]